MCGIAGFIDYTVDSLERKNNIANEMVRVLSHRGPDEFGHWLDEGGGVVLAHTRLAIVDLSPTGAQPMRSVSGRCVISYNGEIYNTAELKAELRNAGINFRGESDTEVLLEACELWGVETALTKIIGMFAFALWDCTEKHLVVARDRLGIKPLYWCDTDKLFCFSSELKAMRCHPNFDLTLNNDAVVSYLRHNYIPAPQSIYKNTFKLLPGSFLIKKPGQELKIKKYWDLGEVVKQNPIAENVPEDVLVSEFEALVADSVKRRMVADVPLGAFLSGGIDSSLIVSAMQEASSQPIKTFAIGFEEQEYNEAVHAEKIAQHLGTDHTSLYVDEGMALDTVPLLPDLFDEPFSDSSQIPTYLVAKMTREHVTVALSGDGGDELFAGYPRYKQTEDYAKILFSQPGFIRQLESKVIKSLSPSTWNMITKYAPSKVRTALSGDKLVRLPKVLESGDEMMLYKSINSHADQPESHVKSGVERSSEVWEQISGLNDLDLLSKMQYIDMLSYLPDDILTKVDRTSMAVSLEARVPLIDHRIVEFSTKLPRNLKVQGDQTKWIMRQSLYKRVPREMVDRPKMGFGVPLGKWLTTDLRDWVEDLISVKELENYGILDVDTIRKKWEQHKSGSVNWQYHLWDAVVLQQWLRNSPYSH